MAWYLSLPLFFVFGLSIGNGDADKPAISQFGARVLAVRKQWDTNTLTPFGLVTMTQIKSFALKNESTPLSEIQLASLHASIQAFYKCYSDTNFNNFKAFRLSVPYKVNTNVFQILKTKNLTEGSTDEKKLEMAWREFNNTNKLTGVALGNVCIEIRVATNSSGMVYDKLKDLIPGAAVGTFTPVITTIPDAETQIAKHGSMVCADLSQFVSATSMKGVAPFHMVYWWCDELNCWIPLEFGFVVSEGYNTLF